MKKVLVIGASGSLAKYVIAELKNQGNIDLSLLVRNAKRLSKSISDGCTVFEGNALNQSELKSAIVGQDLVYINLAGDLESMGRNIVEVMQESGVKRVIAISSIGIYNMPLRSVLVPYRKLADIVETSALDYTIIRPDWFTDTDEIDYAITFKGEPEVGGAVSRKSIASFVGSIIQKPELYNRANVGISKV